MYTQDTEETTVVFRVWKKYPHAVCALFPYLKEDLDGRYCVSYEHIGQHGPADYRGVITATRPARATEYTPLAKELLSIGYKLRIRTRRNRKKG